MLGGGGMQLINFWNTILYRAGTSKNKKINRMLLNHVNLFGI